MTKKLFILINTIIIAVIFSCPSIAMMPGGPTLKPLTHHPHVYHGPQHRPHMPWEKHSVAHGANENCCGADDGCCETARNSACCNRSITDTCYGPFTWKNHASGYEAIGCTIFCPILTTGALIEPLLDSYTGCCFSMKNPSVVGNEWLRFLYYASFAPLRNYLSGVLCPREQPNDEITPATPILHRTTNLSTDKNDLEANY